MDKYQVANILEEIAVLLELKGDNPFKVRAFHNGARAIESLSHDLYDLVSKKKLREIKGIGGHLAQIITDLVLTGRSKDHEALRKNFPDGVLELLKIPGLGPKKVKKLYTELHIKNVRELEYACNENRLLTLEGFGEKTQDKILEGIKHHLKHQDKHLFPQGFLDAINLKNELSSVIPAKAGIQIEIAGSLRRHKELIRDIDILVSSSSKLSDVMDHFVKLKEVSKVNQKGETKSSVILHSGIQVDLRCVKEKEFPYALMYFTGSKEHNTVLRGIAKKKKLKLNEYGLFKGNKNIECKSEEEIYEKLGLSYIPPELRENMGEIEAAQSSVVPPSRVNLSSRAQRVIPKLVEEKDIRGVFHNHTTSSDGNATLEEMVAAAEKLGFEYIGISDHSQSAHYAHGLKPIDVKKQHQDIDKLQKKFKKITILKGVESDILNDGSLDYPDSVLASFDFVIASIHSKFNMPEKEMTHRIVKALKNKYTTMIGHPTGRLILGRAGYQVDVKELIHVAASLGKPVEINANPHRFDIDWRWWPLLKENKVLVSINPDAHSTAGIADVFYGVGIARKAWMRKEDVLNARSLNEVLKII
ncbi:MAG: DNA polymerase/3'-5' exonuclease PolX [Deltaproteobacteria bacterium]|nr:DNA polymerase/3'-5' exonuclease PolX [Deltaproteobacteria bacterium]